MNGEGSPNESKFSGRVEVRQPGGAWGTVCDDEFDINEAMVICKMFGFEYGQPQITASFGQGVGDIFMDDLRCSGEEASIFKCPYNGWGNSNCGHHRDAGVICSADPVSDICFVQISLRISIWFVH